MDIPLHHLDKRIANRSKKKGIITEEQIAKHLDSLPERSNNVHAPVEEGMEETAPAEPGSDPSVDSPSGDA